MLFQKTQSSFESMVHAHSADLYRFAYWLCRDRNVAEDLVQETFTRAWANWKDVRDEKAAKGWLLTILHNEHARLFEKTRVEISDDDLDDLAVAAKTNVLGELEMRDALWKLPEGFREPLLLQVLGGYSCGEIAAMVNLSEINVMQRLTRARQALRKMMEPESQRRVNKS
ncbi:MAG: sigma-70 family RNA polymerase sigma factor [Burkholderiales bacterium]|nr:sigma-70 family RNA polymerase sigma factor [Pseudomonadota bacterium]